jgi:hypothetical protein
LFGSFEKFVDREFFHRNAEPVVVAQMNPRLSKRITANSEASRKEASADEIAALPPEWTG